MRNYMELIYFMRDLGDGVQDHLPEELRTGQLSLNEIVDQWVDRKTCFAIRTLEKDMMSYIEKYRVGDFSVDEILFDFDLLFIPERFGCDESELFGRVLPLLKARVVGTRRSVLRDLVAWVGLKLGV